MANVVIIGDKKLALKFKEISVRVQGDIMNEILDEASDEVKSIASETAPHLTGKLAGSIESEGLGLERDIGPSKEAFYGLFVEKGTSKMGAEPFLEPAIEDERVEEVARNAFLAKIERV